MSSLSDFFGRPFGCFTDVFPGTSAEKARGLVAAGFDCVQFVPDPDAAALTVSAMKDAITPFQDAGLRIVAISGYQNIISPDPATKAAAIARIERLLDLAPLCGEGVGVVTETGTKSTVSPWDFDPANVSLSSWREMEESVRRLVETARCVGSTLWIEGYVNNVVRVAEDYVHLSRAIPGLGAIMDPFNLILEERMAAQSGEIHRIFDLLAPESRIAHAKDLIYRDGRVDTPRAGAGVFDYPTYFRLLDERLPGMPLIVEHVKLPDLPGSLDYLKRAYGRTQEAAR